ncbi:MAG: cell wall-binding repeat-containing protein [Actinobacteria bacterium]|nr:MAG: cell wall-binding repeat-containing protein [Actinomycetota bacterium]
MSPQSTRVAGRDRFDTNVGLSQEGWETSEYVVVASGRTWPDALVGTVLAAALDAPVLLSEPSGVPAVVAAEVKRLGATHAIILGGEAALSPAIETDLEAAGVAAANIERIAGADRYETSALVAYRVVELSGQPGWAVVATGENYPDALAASPWAGALGAPIMLTRSKSVPAPTKTAIAAVDPTAVLVLGSERAIPKDVVDQLPPSWRVGGADRYETARLMAEFASDHDFDFDNVYVTKGTDWPDALGAGALAAKTRGLIMLTPPDRPDNDTLGFFNGHCSSIEQLRFVGGYAAISSDVAYQILQASETRMDTDAVVLIAGDLLGSFRSATPDSVTFSDSVIALARVQVGKILILNSAPVVDPEQPLTHGFVRRVLGVTVEGATVIAQTEDAAITDFLEKGSVDINIDPIQPHDIANQALIATQIGEAHAAGRPVEVASSIKPAAVFTHHFEDARNLWHNEAKTASLDSTLTVDLTVVADLQMAISGWSVQTVSMLLFANESISAELGFAWADELTPQEFALAEIPLGFFGLDIGPINLSVGVQAKPVVGYEQVTGEFDCQFKLTQYFAAGMRMIYIKGQGTRVIHESKSGFDTTFDAHGKATARPYVGVKIEVEICGSDANTIYMMPDAYLWAQAEGEFHAWDNFEHTSGKLDASLEFGVEWRVGYNVDLFGFWSDSDYYAANIYNKTWRFGVGYTD